MKIVMNNTYIHIQVENRIQFVVDTEENFKKMKSAILTILAENNNNPFYNTVHLNKMTIGYVYVTVVNAIGDYESYEYVNSNMIRMAKLKEVLK